MPVTTEFRQLDNFFFQKPMRAIFSGSSQSGKTFLIGQMLKNHMNIFGDEFNFRKYFYPNYLEEAPVEFHTLTDTLIAYEAGFPSKSDILSLP